MKKLILPLLAILLLTACGKEQIVPIDSEASADIDLRAKKKETITLCHLDENGAYVTKEVNVTAEKAHRGHGDFDVPATGSCCSNEGLIPVTLPDGSTIYAQPNDNSSGTDWGPAGSDVFDLVNYITEAEALTDFDGWANTEAIVKAQGPGSYAAKICDDLDAGDGCDNWYLPSLGELRAMKEQGVLPASGGRYWSSTEQFPGFAWVESSLGTTNANKKERIDRRCRCVRR